LPNEALPNQQPEATSAQTPFERELTTKRRGELAELAFTLAAARRGYVVSKPFGDCQRYDVILDPSHPTTIIPPEPARNASPWTNLLAATTPSLNPQSSCGDSRPRLSAGQSPALHGTDTHSWRGQAKDFRRQDHYSHFASASNRPTLARVQVKSSTQLVNGLYRINSGRRLNGRVVPYRLSEVDYIAAYIIPEDSWFILPSPTSSAKSASSSAPNTAPSPASTTPTAKPGTTSTPHPSWNSPECRRR
jgi:hypothetical protein